jgi:murein L,D-transpeptidase YcbB/YkuD
LRRGTTGPSVVTIQTELNRISQSYPAIPKIPVVDGIFGSRTEAAVQKFQEVFNLAPDGIVGPATWYALVRIYVAVNRLAELRSEGQQFYAINWNPPNALRVGSSGEQVSFLQYMLAIMAEFIPEIPPIAVDGIYGTATRAAVLAAQRRFRLPETGIVDAETWNEIYDQYSGIENTQLRSGERFPQNQNTSEAVPAGAFASNRRRTVPTAAPLRRPALPNQTKYNQTTTFTQFPGFDITMGMQDPVRQEVVR